MEPKKLSAKERFKARILELARTGVVQPKLRFDYMDLFVFNDEKDFMEYSLPDESLSLKIGRPAPLTTAQVIEKSQESVDTTGLSILFPLHPFGRILDCRLVAR